MTAQPVRLKFLLQERHWQTFGTFVREYDKAAMRIDKCLMGTAPSRPQFHRWLSGMLTKLPHSHHCQVLEEMLPGWTARQLFEPHTSDLVDAGRQANRSDPMAEVFKAVATGLTSPDSARIEWSLASAKMHMQRSTTDDSVPSAIGRLPDPISGHNVDNTDDAAHEIGRKLVALQKVRRFSQEEIRLLAGLSGNVVDLDLSIDIDIDRDGWAKLTYRHELLNLSDRPLTRISRDLWFEHTRDGRLVISPVNDGARKVVIQRIHDTSNLAKFACQLSPAVQPGETATVQYACSNGRFVADHYWNQTLPRYTRHFTIKLRHRDAGSLVTCTAVEMHPDGSENSATEELLWDYEGDDVMITLTRDYLRPNQSVTLRWEVDHGAS